MQGSRSSEESKADASRRSTGQLIHAVQEEGSRLRALMNFQCEVPCFVRWRWAPRESFLILSHAYLCPTLAPTHQRRNLLERGKGLLGTLALRGGDVDLAETEQLRTSASPGC